jgi:hypothetical protein
MVLGTSWGEYLNEGGRNRKPWLFVIAIAGILVGVFFDKAINDDVDRKTESHFPLLLKHKYPEMDSSDAAKTLVNFDHFDWGFTWSGSSDKVNSKLSLVAIIIGAVEVAFVAILETVVSAILGQQKKCRFTGREEWQDPSEEQEIDADVIPQALPEDSEDATTKEGSQDASSNSDEGMELATKDSEEIPLEERVADVEAGKEEKKKLAPIPPFIPCNEMFGLGLANLVTGFCGGVPCTGVLLRTEVNAETGAESKASQWFNGVIVLVVSVGLLKYFSFLPFFVIAAMLARSAIGLGQGAYRCLNEELLPAIRKNHDNAQDALLAKFDLFNFIAVWLICLFIDGAIGLSFGFVAKYFCWKYCQHNKLGGEEKKMDDVNAQVVAKKMKALGVTDETQV